MKRLPRLATSAFVLFALFTVAPARAQTPVSTDAAEATGPCSADEQLFEGPVALSYFQADTATGRRVCPSTQVSLGMRAGLVLDTADFYGGIGAGGLLSGSHALGPTRELFATLEFLRYDFITNAVIEGTDVGLGQLTLGASQMTFSRGRLGGAVSARLMLPTQTTTNAWLTGLELGHAFLFRPSASLSLHGYLGGDVSAGLSGARALPRLGGLATAGVQYSPWSWFTLALDLNGRVGGFTSYLAPALALRFRVYRGFGAELAASRPLLGSDRHDAVVGLRFGYRL